MKVTRRSTVTLEDCPIQEVNAQQLRVSITGPQGAGKTVLADILRQLFPGLTVRERNDRGDIEGEDR